MRRRSTWVLSVAGGVVLLSLLATVAASRASGERTTQAERIRAVEQTRLSALVDADTPTAAQFIADDFEVIDPAGDAIARDDYLAAVDAGVIDYRAFTPTSPIDVRLHGDAAALRYQVHFDIVVGGELHLIHEGWITELYVRRDGDWQVVWEQATAVPNDFDALLQALKPTG
jgi:ketosteroid isomerase-like protein